MPNAKKCRINSFQKTGGRKKWAKEGACSGGGGGGRNIEFLNGIYYKAVHVYIGRAGSAKLVYNYMCHD